MTLTQSAYELFSAVERHNAVSSLFVECTFLEKVHRGMMLRGFVTLAVALIPIGWRCLDTNTNTTSGTAGAAMTPPAPTPPS